MTEPDPHQKRANQRDLGACKAAVRELLQQISQRNRRLSGLKADLERLRTQEQELEKTRVDLARSEAVVRTLQADKTSLEGNLAKTSTELAKTSTDLTKTRAEIEVERSRHESELAEKNITLNALQSELQEMQSQRAIALEELDLIRHSFGYKVMRFYGSVIDRLLPGNRLRGESNKSTIGSVGIEKEKEVK